MPDDVRQPIVIHADDLKWAIREALEKALDPLRTTIDEMAAQSDEAAAALRRLSGQIRELGQHAGIDLERAEMMSRRAEERERARKAGLQVRPADDPPPARSPEDSAQAHAMAEDMRRRNPTPQQLPTGLKPHRWETEIRLGKNAYVCGDCERDIRDGEGPGCMGPIVRREDNPNRKRPGREGKAVSDTGRRTVWAAGARARAQGKKISACPYASNRGGFRHAWEGGWTHGGTMP